MTEYKFYRWRKECPVCGCSIFNHSQIREGVVREDCARCGRTAGFPEWDGTDPPPRELVKEQQ